MSWSLVRAQTTGVQPFGPSPQNPSTFIGGRTIAFRGMQLAFGGLTAGKAENLRLIAIATAGGITNPTDDLTTIVATDGQGTPLTQIGDYADFADPNGFGCNALRLSLWLVPPSADGMLLLTPRVDCPMGIISAEFSSGGSGYLLDGNVANGFGSQPSMSPSCGPIPVADSGELAVAVFAQTQGNFSYSAGAGFANAAILAELPAFVHIAMDYAPGVSAPVTDAPTYTGIPNWATIAVGASFRAAA